VLCSFFASLAIVIPAVSFSVDAYYVASDSLLAEKISNDLTQECDLLNFLGNFSAKTFEYVPSKSISIKINKNGGIVSSDSKEYYFDCENISSYEYSFSEKFKITLTKINDKIEFSLE